jgi:hypothetical protein
MPLEIEASSRHLAGVISRQASSANVGPHGVDRACRRDADLPDERGTAIATALHASPLVIDIVAGDSCQIGVIFQREPWPLGGKRAARTTSLAVGGGKFGGPRRQTRHLILSLTADSFPRLASISYSTVCPSLSELRPACSTAEIWTNTSLPPPPPEG